MPINENRFPEIDILRSLAILLMVIYHIFFDLDYLGNFDFAVNSGILRVIGRSAAILFIFTSGISLSLSYSKYRIETGNKKAFGKYLKRGFRIFNLGILITFVTWILVPEATILFGILHFLGVAAVLGYFFLNSKSINIPIALIVIILGFAFRGIRTSTDWFLWLGLHSPGFTTLDYFPIFPWFAVFLMGITVGNARYPGHRRKFSLPYNTDGILLTTMAKLGRRSLLIYLIHQPMIIVILYLLGLIELPFF
ncbi:putative membrane protein [Methanohalophilus levihalophilus]|uniref:heparan-alpha-glucosaminide N-acetyltransferase n=1 Tax=Methanohalophilus levihalophilus TaxID=1431282 RepID=UPI001AE19668|nr:heparan-alpha-glucosaminide N-acetyltransferase [Methanohalophilus levihalophilus]MBP2029291.1 putative membrane protein [Methanohalophilus levihalophilus]